jgi:hypothetical protein
MAAAALREQARTLDQSVGKNRLAWNGSAL